MKAFVTKKLLEELRRDWSGPPHYVTVSTTLLNTLLDGAAELLEAERRRGCHPENREEPTP